MAELVGFKFPSVGSCPNCGKPLRDPEMFCDGKCKEYCKRCKNYGYYEVGVSKSIEKLQMFCACEVGQRLKRLKIEWDLKLIVSIGDDTLTRLRVIKNRLHEPSKAGNFLDSLIEDIEILKKRTENALKEIK